MDHKITQALAFIRKARDQHLEAKYVFARDNYIKGLQIMNIVAQSQKDNKKRILIKEQMDLYLKQAEENNKKMKQKALIPPVEKPITAEKQQIIPEKQKHLNQNRFTYVPPQVNPKTPRQLNVKKQVNVSDKAVQQFILKTTDVNFQTIVGMKDTKKAIQQIILLPKKRPDLFTGIRAPPRGIIMYGPPGNGKTFMAKAIATQANCTFFNLSASSLMSKYVGDSQKMLKRIFAEAYKLSPSIIFIDQIDSILTSRSQNQNQASRRLKTQFLVQLDGLTTTDLDSVLCIGATNLPNQLDKAALRRFPKKIYVGPPDFEARKDMLKKHTIGIAHNLSDRDFDQIAKLLDCYSASDIKNVSKQASMLPVRQLGSQLMRIPEEKLRKVSKSDFLTAIKYNPPTVGKTQLLKYGRLG